MSIQEVFTEINRKTVTILGLRGTANDRRGRAKTDSVRGALRYDWDAHVGLFPVPSYFKVRILEISFISNRKIQNSTAEESNLFMYTLKAHA